jgi:hypothetical protein
MNRWVSSGNGNCRRCGESVHTYSCDTEAFRKLCEHEMKPKEELTAREATIKADDLLLLMERNFAGAWAISASLPEAAGRCAAV